MVDGEDIQNRLLPVDDVRAAVGLVVGDDLGDAAVRVGGAQRDAARLFDPERGVRNEAVIFDDVRLLRLLRGDGLPTRVLHGHVGGGQVGVIEVLRVCCVVVGIGEVLAADSLLFGLHPLVRALVRGRDLRGLLVVALHGEQVDVAGGAVFVRHRAREVFCVEVGVLAHQSDGYPFIMKLHVPLGVARRHHPRAVCELVDRAAAHEVVPVCRDVAREREGLPALVAAVFGRAVPQVPAVEGDCGVCLVIQLDEAVADHLGVVGSAEHLVDDDVRHGCVVAALAVRRAGRFRRADRGHGERREEHRPAEREAEHLLAQFFHFNSPDLVLCTHHTKKLSTPLQKVVTEL